MVLDLNVLMAQLSERLLALDWQLSRHHAVLRAHQLPKGLFKQAYGDELISCDCVEEIRRDMDALMQQQEGRSARFIVDKINKKINVLVHLCQSSVEQKPSESSNVFNVSSLVSRQRWIQESQQHCERLELQHQALLNTAKHEAKSSDVTAELRRRQAISDVARQLTLAKEALATYGEIDSSL